jgi:hypothetical protein
MGIGMDKLGPKTGGLPSFGSSGAKKGTGKTTLGGFNMAGFKQVGKAIMDHQNAFKAALPPPGTGVVLNGGRNLPTFDTSILQNLFA